MDTYIVTLWMGKGEKKDVEVQADDLKQAMEKAWKDNPGSFPDCVRGPHDYSRMSCEDECEVCGGLITDWEEPSSNSNFSMICQSCVGDLKESGDYYDKEEDEE